MVTRTYYDDYFRPFSLYFFDAPGERLVPDLVHLAVGEQLPTGLVTALARGPGRTPGTLRTYVPGAGALRPSVTVGDDDVADVEFSTSLTKLSGRERDRLAAQIVWTLRSVPGAARRAHLRGHGDPLQPGRRVHPVDAWGGFGPPAGERPHVCARRRQADGDRRRHRQPGQRHVGTRRGWRSGGRRGQRRRGRRDPRSRPGAGSPTGRRRPDSSRGPVHRASAGTTTTGSGSSTGRAARHACGGRGPQSRDLSRRRSRVGLRSFAISPDSGWYATTDGGGGTSIYVGPVRRDGDDRLTGLGDPRRLTIGVDEPRSVGWVSTTRLAFLGASDAGVQLHRRRATTAPT